MSDKQLFTRPLSSFRPRRIRWLFYPFIPRGYITTIGGDGAVGKTTMIYDIIARLTMGEPMPSFGEEEGPDKLLFGSAIILTKEDDPRGMMRARLKAAGADITKVHVIGTAKSKDPDDFDPLDRIDTTLNEVEDLICELRDVRVIVLDPVTDFAGDLNMYREDHVRRLLTPLADLAKRYNLAVINVLHMVKDTKRKARQRILGSVGLVNISRSVLFVGQSAASERRLLMMEKANLVRDKRSVAFAIKDDEDQQPVIEWEHEWEDDVDPDVILSKPSSHVTKQQQAAHRLRAALADGPRPANEMKELADTVGYHFNTFKAAKKEIGIKSEKREDGWWWSLPEQPPSNIISFDAAPKRRERLLPPD